MVYGLIALALVAIPLLVAGHIERELYMLRWFDMANRADGALPPWNKAIFADRGRPLRAYLRETIYGLVYTATLVVARLLGWMRRKKTIRYTDNAPLVALIHGYKASGAHFWLMRWRLRKLAPNVMTFTYDGSDPATPHHRRLRDAILAARKNGASARTLIVGQSYGGIIGFDYANECAEADEMVGLAALGTPFHGSRLAALSLSPLARSMTPTNPRFATLLSAAPGCPFLSLFSRYDQFVIPYTNSEHPTADNRVVDSCGHAGLFSTGGSSESCVNGSSRSSLRRPPSNDGMLARFVR